MGMMSKQDAPARIFPCQLKFSTCDISQAFLACGSEHYHLFGQVLGYIPPKDSYFSMMSVMLRHVCRLTDQYCLFGLGGCLTRLEI
jgi:hypothetical protein